jgi:opacity protein-like surface antigen
VTSKTVMLAVALLAGVSGSAWANGTEIPPPEPSPYTPPPAPVEMPAPPPPATGGFYISGAVGIGIPGTFNTDYSMVERAVETCTSDDQRCDKRDKRDKRDRYDKRDKRTSRYVPQQTCTTQTEEYLDTANGSKFDLKSGLALNGAIGYNFGSTRLEGAVGYQKHDFNEGDNDLSLLTVMANVYYDFGKESNIRPYIMGGAGMAHVNMSWTDETEDVFAWQVGAGVGVKVAKNTTLDLGYRYLKPGNFDSHSLGDGKLECHNIMLGLRYQF